MKSTRYISINVVALLALTVGAAAMMMAQMQGGMAMSHTSTQFAGPKANAGTVTHSNQDGKSLLTLSDDFKVPDTPDPHWQLVDASGKTYLLDRVALKGGKVNRTIEIPAYVPNVVKVQIWCAFAETNLGEASFSQPVK
jgi:hypothetical protein